jgi:hypothetical protein
VLDSKQVKAYQNKKTFFYLIIILFFGGLSYFFQNGLIAWSTTHKHTMILRMKIQAKEQTQPIVSLWYQA